MKAHEFVTEAPLADYQPVGDFTKTGPFRGADRRLVPHPVSQLKTQKFFEQTPYDFRLFFSNIPGTGKYSEMGAASAEQLQQMFGTEISQQLLTNSQNAITVVFVGNSGAAKVIMTPWIMAHRIGHAIQAGQRMSRNQSVWRAAEGHFFRGVNELLIDFYGRRSRATGFTGMMKQDMTAEYNALFNAIGTQRSSRSGEIKRPYEFLYELFAQYIGTGNITLKPLPKQQDYGRKTFGRSNQQLRLHPGAEQESQYTTEVLARDMEFMFNDVLSSMVGQILVM